MSLALDDALSRRIEAIDAELRAVDTAIRLDGRERSRQLSSVADRARRVAEGRERAEALLGRIRELRDGPKRV